MTTISTQPETALSPVQGVTRRFLSDLRQRLDAAFGRRLKHVIVFGSRARGDAQPESDLDLMIVLEGPIQLWPDIHTIVDSTYPLRLTIDFPIHSLPVSETSFEAGSCAVHREAKREGVRL